MCNEIKEVKIFSLLVDETKDISKQEQMSIVVRYINSEGVLHEHFLTYVQAVSLTAESLTNYILDTLCRFDLDPEWIVSQGYDGASVMSGHCSRVQQRIREVAPNAIYIHCYAHTLNLVLVDCVKMVQHAAEFFILLECLSLQAKLMQFFCRNKRNSTQPNNLCNCKSFQILGGHADVEQCMLFAKHMTHFWQCYRKLVMAVIILRLLKLKVCTIKLLHFPS